MGSKIKMTLVGCEGGKMMVAVCDEVGNAGGWGGGRGAEGESGTHGYDPDII